MASPSLIVLVPLSRFSGSDLTGARCSNPVVIEWSPGAAIRSTGVSLFTGDSQNVSSVHTSSPGYLRSNALHQESSPCPLQAPPSSFTSGSLIYCMCGIPPLSSISSFHLNATTTPNVAPYVKFHWDSGEQDRDSLGCSNERLAPLYHLRFLPPSLSCSGDLPGFLPDLVKHDDMVNLISWAWSIFSIRLAGFDKNCLCWWAWSINVIEAANYIYLPDLNSLKTFMRLNIVDWVCVYSFKISDGLIGVFTVQLLSYFSCLKNFSVDSPWLPPVSPSLCRGEFVATMPPL